MALIFRSRIDCGLTPLCKLTEIFRDEPLTVSSERRERTRTRPVSASQDVCTRITKIC
jgi:hypothetical protein